MVFCLEEKTCKSLNYAEHINDGQENCELHNERNNENSLEFVKDDKYTFYQIFGELQESETGKTTENATEKVSILLHRKQCLAKE